MKSLLALWATLLYVRVFASGFENLNFENVIPGQLRPRPGEEYDRVEIAYALRGWQVYTGDQKEHLVLVNNQFLGSAGAGLLTKLSPNGLDFSTAIIEGNSSALLQAGARLHGEGHVSTSILQKGTIPAGSQSLIFNSREFGSPFSVSLNGSMAPVVGLVVQDPFLQRVNTYGVDVSALGGQDVELKFTVIQGTIILDNLHFSTTSVPEPFAPALLGLGTIVLIWNFRSSSRAVQGLASAGQYRRIGEGCQAPNLNRT